MTHADSHHESDARLVEQSRKGSQAAFEGLVRRYERRLLKVIGRFLRDPDQVEDIAQETFLKAYRRLDQFDSSRRFGPWLFRIAVNLVFDALRSQQRRRRWLRLFTYSASTASHEPYRASEGKLELHEEVRQVIEGMPQQYRAILILRDLENFSTTEVAGILQRRESTIRWKLAEARRRFQHAWEARERQVTGLPTTGSQVSSSSGESSSSRAIPPFPPSSFVL